MKISDIPQIAAWISEAGIATYELTGPDFRICLRRSIQARARELSRQAPDTMQPFPTTSCQMSLSRRVSDISCMLTLCKRRRW